MELNNRHTALIGAATAARGLVAAPGIVARSDLPTRRPTLAEHRRRR
ncbi:hypothetical protein WN990_29440 [Kitasatospora purpeofusca]